MADTYKPPASAAGNAKRALEWRKKYPDQTKGAGTQVGWTRASQLASGKPVSLDVVKRMAQFARHKKNAVVDPKFKDEPWRDKGYLMYLAWGGQTGIDWAKRIAESADKADNTPQNNTEGAEVTIRVNLQTTINAEKVRIDKVKEDGRDVWYIRNHVWLKDGIVLNGGLYSAEENEKGYESMAGTLFTNGHPKVNGEFVTISNQDNEKSNDALVHHYMYASNRNIRKEGGQYLKDIRIDVNNARNTDGGKALLAWCEKVSKGDNPDRIHTSTGLLCTRKELTGNSSGKNYTWSATNQRYDHDSLLLNEQGAGGDDISLAVNNGEQIECLTVNLDDAVTAEQSSDTVTIENNLSLIQKIAKALGVSVKSFESNKSVEREMTIAEQINKLLGVDVFAANETDEEIVDKFKKKHRDQDKDGGVSEKVEEEEEEDEDEELDENKKKTNKKKKPETNAMTPEQIQQMIQEGIKQGLATNAAQAENAEKEVIVNKLISDAAFTADQKTELMSNSLFVLKALAEHKPSVGIVSNYNSFGGFEANEKNESFVTDWSEEK